MERVVGVAVNDANLLATFAQAHADAMDVSEPEGSGAWGLGFYGNGELLVRRAPIGTAFEAQRVLERVRAGQLLLIGDHAPDRRRTVADRQPHRYREWLFAAAGTRGLSADFVRRVQAGLPDRAFSHQRAAVPSEAALMVFIDALSRAHVRAAGSLTTDAIRAALQDGVSRLSSLAGAEPLQLAVLLHTQRFVFGLAIGRPLHLQRIDGLGRARRGSAHAHFKAVIVSDQPKGEGPWELVRPGDGVELGSDCSVTSFSVS